MIEYGCRPEHARAVHLGIASHNLFDVAHGLVLREERGVEAWVEFEMLEGMANHQARAVQARAGGLLLYAPVVRAEDFHSAIAYLVRRLDENTAPDNFLRHVFGLEPGSPDWDLERDRFLGAFELVDGLSDAPRRPQDRGAEAVRKAAGDLSAPFANEPDTDWRAPPTGTGSSGSGPSGASDRWRRSRSRSGASWSRARWRSRGGDRSHPARVAYRHALADRRQVSRALDAARAAQGAWGERPAAERRRLLEPAGVCSPGGAGIGRRHDRDGAKTVAEADPEVSEAIDFARYYARALGAGDTVDGCRLTPLGVVVVAPPWNFPLSIPAGGVLAALAAGNAVLLKPAPEAVLVGWHLASALWEAGIPREALQFVPCPDDEVGRGLITDARVDAVILTGSVETARRFLGWRPDLRLFAETSGKNAIIVTALADRDQAVRDLVRSAFGHNGQKCSAASLAICEVEVYDDAAFRRQLRDAAASLAVGRAWEGEPRHPAHQPPGAALQRALTTLDAGEEWLLEPRALSREAPLWSRASSWACVGAHSSIELNASGRCWGSCGPRISTRRSSSRTTRRSGSRAGSSRSTTGRSRAGSSTSRPAPSTSTATSPGPSWAASRSAAGRPPRSARAPRPAARTTCSSSAARARGRRRSRSPRCCKRPRPATSALGGSISLRCTSRSACSASATCSGIDRADACSCGARRPLRPAGSRSRWSCSPRARAACR